MTTSLQAHKDLLTSRINDLFTVLCDRFAESYGNTQYYHPDILKYEIVPGSKYYKIVMHQNGSKSVHAFIHKQSGAVFKPASWKAPAKHVRYNLLDDASFQECLKRADWAGGYLYL